MANVSKRGAAYWVRWKELVVSRGPTGEPVRTWKDRSRTFPSKADAEVFAKEVDIKHARGEVVVNQREQMVATLGEVYTAYAAACPNERTRKWRRSMIGTFVTWAGPLTPVRDLTSTLLKRYAESLPSDGRAASTRHRKVLGVEAMWTWAYDPRQRDEFPGVPEPVRISGTDVNAPVQAPAPVVRVAVPEVSDVDLMISCLRSGWRHGDAHRRVALLCRYTGIRIAQAVNLLWRDVRLDYPAGPHVILRAQSRGAKKGRTRVVPLHPALVAEMQTWSQVREGRVFDAKNERWTRGESTREAMRTAWISSGVDPAKWDIPDDVGEEGERGHGSPTHAVRAAVFTALLRSGTSLDIAEYVIGHATPATRGAYVPENAPESSPIWTRLVDAVGRIPAHR